MPTAVTSGAREAPSPRDSSSSLSRRHAILVADSYAEEGIDILRDGGANRVEYSPSITPQDLAARIGEFDALVVRSRSNAPRSLFEAGKRLKIVGRAGVGLDNIDVEAATDHGVIVMNAPGGNTVSTAEHTWTMLMALARRVPDADASMKAGQWEKKKFGGVELRGKTLGVLGLGRIGREVAGFGRAFGMKVIAYDPYVAPGVFEDCGAERGSVEGIAATADFLTLHMPLTDQTRGMINADLLSAAKPSLRLVNCARGALVDETALADALKSGRIAGAALDVFDVEPLAADHPFRKLPNVVLTPHLAASTGEAELQVAIEMSRQIVEALRDGVIRNAANAYNLDGQQLEEARPFLDLAKRLGSLLSQLSEGPVQSLRLSTSGRASELKTISPLSTAFLVGYLQPSNERRVNAVNARRILDEHGIELLEARREGARLGFDNILEVCAECGDPSRETNLKATVLGAGMPRLVEVNGKRVDNIPAGYILVLENEDVPGVVGAVATILGKHRINISQMTWGRRKEGGSEAMTVINCDQPVSAEALEEIRQAPGILRAKWAKV
jgi:D-3-phosphoglycerate dehydrogenase